MKQKKIKIASHTLFIYKAQSNKNSLMDTPTTSVNTTGILLK